MNLRSILIRVWQKKPLRVSDFLFLTDRFDMTDVVETLKWLDKREITVNEAEEDLKGGRV